MNVGEATTAPPDPRARQITLEVKNLTKRYSTRTAVENVSFQVRAGEFLALLGPSGAGKTTLFRCIAGLTTPEFGAVTLSPVEMARRRGRERRRIAVVFQQFNLVGRLSALDNVLAGRLGFVSAWRGMLRRFKRDDVLLALECLARVGLLDRAQQRAATLSGGQQQRVAIARALAQNPDVIVADEPVASLDPQISADILELLQGICRRDGVAVVCSLHQLHLAQAYADRIVGLAGGRVMIDMDAARFDAQVAAKLYGSIEDTTTR
jgi:phosphonate transport system ATP-binding protein